MNYKKWYFFLKEQQEEQKLTDDPSGGTALVKTDTADNVPEKEEFLEPVVTDDLSVFEIQIKVQVPKKEAVLLTQIKDRIRAIVSVTTVGTDDLEDVSKLYDLRYLNLKFALSKGENVDHYIHQVLTPKLRLIRNLRVLHYGKVRKVR
jgi:hypothetical protein